MDTVFTGRIWKLPDDVDTDTIIPGRYGVLPSAEEMSRHCLEPLRPELAAAARPGDIFVAGKNFGCGSSREFAPACIAALGVRCIVAKSFARIFYRNGIRMKFLYLSAQQFHALGTRKRRNFEFILVFFYHIESLPAYRAGAPQYRYFFHMLKPPASKAYIL